MSTAKTLIANNLITGGGKNQPINNNKKRIDYVDLLKGIAILSVIWSHTDNVDIDYWHPGTFGNVAFFVMSGIFFKITDVKTFFSKKAIKILLPFFVFYLLSIPFRMIVELWDYRDFSQITYNMVWDIFKIEGRSDYLYANVPLWFLLAIFVIQFIGLWIFRLPKWAVLLFAVSVIFLRDEILSIPTPFMINNGLYWFGFFALGYLFGKPFMGYITGLKHKLIVLTSSLAVALTCIYIGHMGLFNSNPYSSYLLNISLVIFLLTIASFFNGMKSVNFLRFLGVNTLLILCTHLWFLTPISRLSFKLTNIHAPGLGIILTIITSVIMIPFINFINKRFPILSGK